MNRLRLWIGLTFVWLLVLYNIERFHEPINLASFVYVLTAVVSTYVIAAPRLRRISVGWQIAALFLTLFVLKWLLSYPILGPALPLTVTEACVLLITFLLSRRIGAEISQFEHSAQELTLMRLVDGSQTTLSDRNKLYREVRRARRYERPIGLVAVEADSDSSSESVSPLLEEIQRRTVKHYLDARLAQVVVDATNDSELVTYCDDHFVIALPEAKQVELNDLAKRLQETAQAELGLKVRTGTATFPNEEVTLSGLMERAKAQMQAADSLAAAAASPEPEPIVWSGTLGETATAEGSFVVGT